MMLVYGINILITIGLGIYAFNSKTEAERQKRNLILCIVCSLLWIIISGFRDLSIGADTESYLRRYTTTQKTSLLEIWNSIIARFESWDNFIRGDGLIKDAGYTLFEKICQFIAPTYRLYLILVAIIFFSLLGKFIYKNTKSPYLAFLLFDCLFYSFYAITGLRQTIATAIIVFLGFDFIKKRKFFPFLVLSLIAFMIHKSSICFVPTYFLYGLKIKKWHTPFVVAFFILSCIFRYQIASFLGDLLGYEQYAEQYATNGPLSFTLSLIIFACYIAIFRNKMGKGDECINFKIICLFLSLLFVPLVFINPSIMRVVDYFALFLMLLGYNITEVFPNDKGIIYVAISFVLILVLCINNPVYYFCF